ncbi:unnamed protein product [Rotaria sp. Silwood1]|nr:unnamed protein product [Rotaria sp. Silwood1]
MTSLPFLDELIKACSTILTVIQSCWTKRRELTKESDEAHESNNDLSLVRIIDSEELCLFAPSDEVSALFTEISGQIQNIIRQLRHSSNYVEVTYNYFLDFLYNFHFIDDRFTETFTVNLLSTFEQSLTVFIQSIEAYLGAQSGDITVVKKFLAEDPSSKNRPLLNGHTLLYAATMNNCFEMIKYLIEEAKCSVNALNQNDVSTDMDTPLHVACSNGYLDIVRYLLGQGANCYIENKKKETATIIAKSSSSLYDVFCNHLVLDYTGKESGKIDLPTMTIANELSLTNYDKSSAKNNCVWEFKPLHQQHWQVFMEKESNELSTNLRDKSDMHIDLDIQGQIYTISMMKFLKEVNSQNLNENQAWIRCRGSNIYNFDVISLWQMMLIMHPSITNKIHQEPQLKTITVPSIFDRNQFAYHLNSWYNADEIISKSIDEAINQRLRYLTINTRLLGRIIFNLELFSFTNESKTIQGYLRWLPKFVNFDMKAKRMTPVDNFQAIDLQNNPPIPLRNKLLREFSAIHDQTTESSKISDENNDSSQSDDVMPDVTDHFNDNETEEKKEYIEDVSLLSVQTEVDTKFQCNSDEELIIVEIEPNNSAMIENIQNNIREKRNDLNRENAKVKHYEQIVQKEHNLLMEIDKKKKEMEPQQNLISKLCESLLNPSVSEEFISLQKEYEKQEKILKLRMDELNNIKQDYDQLQHDLTIEQNKVRQFQNLQREEEQAVKELIQIKYNIPSTEHVQLQPTIVENYLRTLIYPGKTAMHEKNIRIHVDNYQTKEHYILWNLEAYSVHHVAMNAIRSRTEQIIRQVARQKTSYRNKIAISIRSFIKTISNVQLRCSSKNWKIFMEIFQHLINNAHEMFCQQFNVEIGKKVRPLINDMIQNISDWWNKLAIETNNYLTTHDFMKSIEELKRNAFKQFVIKTKEIFTYTNEYTKRSSDVREVHLRQLQYILDSDIIYSGHQPHHFSLLSSLIHRVHVILQCFKLKLPLFESSVDLLEKIHENTVVAISTATGSGKSTLLPPLLVAAGYEKILITQPRRLPCNLLSKRVNSSMDSSSLSGWAVSGARSSNVLRAPILYLTDGLLKEYLLYRERYLIQQAEISKHGLVFFVDEVHERSINIDLCLTLLARFLEKNPSIHSKLKIIISSATVDPSIARIFRPFKLHEMKLETSTLHQVDRKPPCTENIIDLVSRLNQQLESNEQILCFVKSAQEVTQLIKLLKLVKGLPAFPLVQSQPSSEQQKLIETKHIFFSTTVAETSLTFPSLKYVIDTGLIHMPVYDPSTDTTELCELNAAESTVKQRQGRLGRTRSGEYYPLYTFNPSDKKFPVPQICQTELVQIEFSLRKSPLGCGFDHLKRWMPNPPSEQAIDAANKRLHQLDILDKHKYFTAIGVSISKLPDFGNIAMSKAVLIGLEKYNCGRDIIRLAAFLGVLNTSSILRSIPARYTKAEGDFMTLLTVMDAVLAQKLIQPPHLFDIDDACKQTNLGGITHILQRAVLRYESFENFFSSSKEYRAAAQCSSNGDWESIARALLEGYSDNVYLSLAEIQGRKHYYLRYTVPNTTEKQRKAVLDSTSKLARPLSAQPISLVLARDIRVSTDIRARSILSILGEIQPDWLDRALERDIPLTNKEIQKYNEEIKSSPDFMTISSNIVCSLSGRQLTLSGQAGCVLATELHIRNKLVVKYTTQIISEDEIDKSLKQNVENLIDTLHIFLPMVWRWKAEKQVKIRFLQTKKEGEIVIKARDEDYEKVRKELDSFVGWLRPCKSLHLHPGLSPRRFIDPQTKQPSSDIESRIRRITDITQTSVDLWPRVRGPAATRETRMEVVAWTAVCHFHCKLEGGFIRDWVVANQSARPPLSTPRQQWVQFQNNIPAIDKGLIPSDLDCHLPIDHHFDIDRFLDEMHKFEISTEVYRQHWRYILLFDRDYPTGPFTMDLIEPHVALTHNRIDFDVNNLYVMREFCAELGQRVNLHDPPFSIDLEEIVQKIKSKQFRVLRPIDNIVQTRIDKMLARGWQKTDEDLNYIPPPQNNFKFVLDPLPQNYQLYQQVENAMKQIPNVKILSIEQIRNPVVYETYHAMKKLITGQCPDGNPNECYLFHGTYTNNAESIMTMGFDDRYFSKNGLYGHGAYFADKPIKSHQYTRASETDTSLKMFYSQVTLGQIFDKPTTDSSLVSAPEHYHSVRGLANADVIEYIVYRSSQAVPYLLITYQA